MMNGSAARDLAGTCARVPEGMRRWRNDNRRVRGETFRGQSNILRRLPHDRQIDLAVGDHFQNLPPVSVAKGDRNTRIVFAEPGDHVRDDVFGGGDKTQTDPSAAEPLQRQHRLVGIVQRLQDRTRVPEQQLAGIRDRHRASDALEQSKSAGRLDLFDLERHRRRRQVQMLGDPRQRAPFRHLDEDLQLPEGYVAHGKTRYP